MKITINYNNFAKDCVEQAIKGLQGKQTVKQVTDVANKLYVPVVGVEIEPREVGHILRNILGYEVVKRRAGYTIIISE